MDGMPGTKAMRQFGDPGNQNRVKNRQRAAADRGQRPMVAGHAKDPAIQLLSASY
jgi:hypothetical protein